MPASHKFWDADEELDLRLAPNNRRNTDDLISGLTIELAAGDLLVFSANMIHRGLYGLDRLAFLFFDPELTLVKYVKDDCLPSQAIINTLAHSKIP